MGGNPSSGDILTAGSWVTVSKPSIATVWEEGSQKKTCKLCDSCGKVQLVNDTSAGKFNGTYWCRPSGRCQCEGTCLPGIPTLQAPSPNSTCQCGGFWMINALQSQQKPPEDPSWG